MSFVLRMALRELRASWRRLLFFFLCMAIGVAAIVTVRSVVQGVRSAMSQQARALTGADIVVTSNREFTPAVRRVVDRERDAGRITVVSEATELATMVRPSGAQDRVTRMVELRAVGPAFPLYGTLTLRDGRYTHALLQHHGALVRPELLAQLHVRPGDHLLIGTATFEIRGVIAEEPGRSLGAFSLGSRVLIDLADLPSTGLLTFGSRVSYQLLLGVPPSSIPSLATRLRGTFANEFVGVRGYWQNQDRLAENLTRAENYLSLVGLVVLILGGIGVSSVTRVFVQQKIRSIAILKCLGCSARQVLSVYVVQVVLLGAAGSVLGIGLAAGIVMALPRFLGSLATLLPSDYGLTWGAALQGAAVGLLVALLFSLVPLLEVRRIRPSLLLRQERSASPRFDRLKWTVAVVVGALLVAVAAWQAGSVRVALVLTGGLLGTTVVLHLAGTLLIRAIRPLRQTRSFALRQAVIRVGHPGNQTRVILIAVGLGCLFILGVRSLQVSLLQDFAVEAGGDAPDMFLIDIQPSQRQGLAAFVDAENGADPAPALIPTLRARVVAVRGRDVNLESYEQVRGRGSLSREYTVTYRPNLEANERVVAGSWWGSGASTDGAEVSIEQSLRDRFQIQVGDEMRFNVLGRVIPARVTSIRQVDWRDFRTGGFMIVFRPGLFDDAPHTFIASTRGPAAPDARARMQATLVSRYPNVSVIDLREILDTISGIVRNVTLGVTVVGALVLFSGILILIGAVSMTKFQRVYEAAILKTLGASGRLIALMLLLEYGVLGAIAGTIGALGSLALSYGIARFALDLAWTPAPLLVLAGVAGTAGLVAVVGVVASLDVLRHKPLATLRAE